MRLFIETMQVGGGIIGRAIDELRWPAAVHPGDTLRVEIEILEARLSKSKPGYGLIRYRSLTKNQDDKVVQSFIALAILPTRPPLPNVTSESRIEQNAEEAEAEEMNGR